MTIISTTIPENRMRQFHEILCATGGRYLGEPFKLRDHFHVRYQPGDHEAHQRAWMRCTTDISEVRRDQRWRYLLRRVKRLVRRGWIMPC